MASILFPGRGARGRRPPWPAVFNRHSNQATGLIAWCPLVPGYAPWEMVSKRQVTATALTATTRIWPEFGPAVSFAAGTSYLDLGMTAVPSTATFTAWLYLPLLPVGSQATAISVGYNGSHTQLELILAGGASAPRVQSYDGSGHGVTAASNLTTARPILVGATYDGAAYHIYMDGVLSASATDTAPTVTSRRLLIGAVDNNGSTANFWPDGDIIDARVYGRALSDAEHWALYDPATRWDLYWQPGRRVFVDVSAGGGSIIEPGVGGLVIAGQVPTLFTAVNIATGLGSLQVSGLAPVASVAHLIATGLGSLPISGLAPALSQGLTIATGAGSLPISGQAPTLQRAFQVSPSVGAVTISGLVPTVSVTTGTVVQPSAGALTISGLAPSASVAHLIATGAGAVQIAGQTPTVQSGQRISVSAGSVRFSGLAPTAEISYRIETGAGQVTFTGHVPSLGGATSITTGAGALTLTGLIPAISTGIVVMPAAGQVTYTGLAPALGLSLLVSVPAGSVEFDGLAPSLVNSGLLVSTLYVDGTYRPTVNLTGSYRPTINVTGEYQ